MNALLNAQGLSVTFGGLKAVDGLDISIREGHIHALIGPNGAGKALWSMPCLVSLNRQRGH